MSRLGALIMNRRQLGSKRRSLSEINIVPYIDVMLVLLVIFMITTPLLTQGVDVHLPKAKAKAIQTEDQIPLIISIDKSGQYYLNVSNTPTTPMSAENIATRVAAELKMAQEAHHKKSVYVKGDEGVDYGKVVSVMALLQGVGANDIGLMTDSVNKNG